MSGKPPDAIALRTVSYANPPKAPPSRSNFRANLIRSNTLESDMNYSARNTPYFLCFAAVLAGALVLISYFHWLDHDVALSMLHEDGVVEILSACGYFACFAVMAIMGRWTYAKRHFALMILVVLFGLRELDFDKRFTDTGLLQSRIITSADVALFDRMLGIIVVALLATLVIYLVRRYLWVFFLRLRAVKPAAVGIATAASFMVISKAIDGIGRKLAPVGISVSQQVTFTAVVVEEVLELGIPIILTIAVVAYIRGQKATRSGRR